MTPSPHLAAETAAPVPAVPYSWQNVAIGGGGFVTGIVFHPAEPGLCYARTDVGGAYRWDAGAARWTPLTDWLGVDDANLTGIESIAVDPRDPERLYLGAGTYSHPRSTNGAMFLSGDRGRTFVRVDMPFKMGANEAGRGAGERLAVDPNDGRVLFFGSRADGLWRSEDRGESWIAVEAFPQTAVSDAAAWAVGPWKQQIGIVFVAFEPTSGAEGRPSQILYAGVSTRETSLFRSSDGGRSWEPVPGQPVGFRPNHMVRASDGTWLISYGDDPGPNSMTDGALWRYDPAKESWSDITPLRSSGRPREGFGYGAVAVDPVDPDVIITSTFCRWEEGDAIFRTTNGGRNWTSVFIHSTWDHTGAPWTEQHEPHWIADIEIDPFDPDHMMFVTGYGIWATHEIGALDRAGDATVRWTFENAGLEETVPLGLISPPEGAHLLSVIGDIDGFRHDDLMRSTRQFAAPPRFANGEGLDFAECEPLFVVRTGTLRQRTTESRGAWSRDGGLTWTAFGTEPPDGQGAGVVAVGADGSSIVWTPRGGRAHVSRDLGATWTACSGLDVGMRVVADRANPRRFYACDSRGSVFLASGDGGSTFLPLATNLPAAAPPQPGTWQPFGTSIRCVPGREGELWVVARGRGLFHSCDGGTRFAAPPLVNDAFSLGFGRAAPGRERPTLFLAGRVDGAAGLFRSDDDGASWMRIGNDAHRFGWIDHVTGDPRIFGRVYFGTGGRGIFFGDPE